MLLRSSASSIFFYDTLCICVRYRTCWETGEFKWQCKAEIFAHCGNKSLLGGWGGKYLLLMTLYCMKVITPLAVLQIAQTGITLHLCCESYKAFEALFVNSLGSAVWNLGHYDHLLSQIFQYPIKLSLSVSSGNDSWVFAFSVTKLVCFIFSFSLLQRYSGGALTFCMPLLLSCSFFVHLQISRAIFWPFHWGKYLCAS